VNIIEKKLNEIKPYEKNPRRNDDAVKYVVESIKEFGFKVPIIIDKNGIIVAGHTRYKAAKKLNMEKVPCVIADDLTEEQVKAFRLADNKTSEMAAWDFDLLHEELDELQQFDFSMEDFGFYNNFNDDEFDDLFESKAKEQTESRKDESADDFSGQWKVIVRAESEEEAQEIAELLNESGYECEVMRI
jgi:ParB family chromosome partitioning protein